MHGERKKRKKIATLYIQERKNILLLFRLKAARET